MIGEGDEKKIKIAKHRWGYQTRWEYIYILEDLLEHYGGIVSLSGKQENYGIDCDFLVGLEESNKLTLDMEEKIYKPIRDEIVRRLMLVSCHFVDKDVLIQKMEELTVLNKND